MKKNSDPMSTVLQAHALLYPEAPEPEVFVCSGLHDAIGYYGRHESSLSDGRGIITLDDALPIRIAADVLAHELAHSVRVPCYEHDDDFWETYHQIRNLARALHLRDHSAASAEWLEAGFTVPPATWPSIDEICDWCDEHGVAEAD